MKAILEFNLDEAEDQQSHMLALKSVKMLAVLWEYDQYLRNQLKYCDKDLTDAQYDVLEKAREKLNELMQDHYISFDELSY